jgi:hypothetical protein
LWRRANSGTFTHQWGGGQNPAAPYRFDSSTATTTWEYRSVSDDHDAATAWYLSPADGGGLGVGASNIAQDVHVDAIQLEAGEIGTSFIAITAGAFASRGADSLLSTTGTAAGMIGNGNRLSALIEGVALGPLSKMTGTISVFAWTSSGGVTTRLNFEPSTRIATYAVAGGGGSFSFPVALPDCVRGDKYEMFLGTDSAGQTSLRARVNGGSIVNCGTSGALGAVPSTTPQLALGAAGATPTQVMDFMFSRFTTYRTGEIPDGF